MPAHDIEQVRRFNRVVAHRIGALEENFLGRGRPMAESRLLFEVGPAGREMRSLRRSLSLDSGYFSRLVRSLEREGLVVARRTRADARVKQLVPTARGLEEIAELDARSDELARSLLGALPREQRGSLVDAMSTVRRLMQAASVEVSPQLVTTDAARHCLREYYAELGRRFEGGFDVRESLPAAADDLTPPSGIFVIASLDGEPVGCGALKLEESGVADVKRMWVSTNARRLGVGQRILGALERHAADLGAEVLQLETNRALHEAQALYRKAGFVEVEPFSREAYAHHWFRKRVSGGGP